MFNQLRATLIPCHVEESDRDVLNWVTRLKVFKVDGDELFIVNEDIPWVVVVDEAVLCVQRTESPRPSAGQPDNALLGQLHAQLGVTLVMSSSSAIGNSGSQYVKVERAWRGLSPESVELACR